MSEILEYVKSQKDTKLKIRKELNKQIIATQPKKAEELIANLVVYNQAIRIMANDFFDLQLEDKESTESIKGQTK
jgi:hypothetical protein